VISLGPLSGAHHQKWGKHFHFHDGGKTFGTHLNSKACGDALLSRLSRPAWYSFCDTDFGKLATA
jgi:hypothetical protein